MKVGEYVRTKWGYICKIININDFREPSMKYGVEASYLKDIMFIGDEDIIKSSPNIIDLIQIGDYIDGLKVIDIVEHLHGHKDIVMTNGKFQWSTSNNDYDIKSIVTKEQFSSMEYKVN